MPHPHKQDLLRSALAQLTAARKSIRAHGAAEFVGQRTAARHLARAKGQAQEAVESLTTVLGSEEVVHPAEKWAACQKHSNDLLAKMITRDHREGAEEEVAP
ncbi:MAG: hypothetical protein H6739_29355 [Alphaproteobacteria bacterium]|nr:hypothetical protein [Alphaproteobacteria bacterium]